MDPVSAGASMVLVPGMGAGAALGCLAAAPPVPGTCQKPR